jgi:putative flavoprotein involved in K+ transport
VWRNRYESLTLHNPVWLNHLPFMEFPDTWPVYIPKDKLANWFEVYAEAMELNVWTSTSLTSAVYDTGDQRWTISLDDADGSSRQLRPAHVVMATGNSGAPKIPDIPGMSRFEGSVVHASQYRRPDGKAKRVLIFGTGNSAHDIAHDMIVNGGCEVTMVQRNSTTVINLDTVHDLYDRYSKRLPAHLSDLTLVSTPYPLAIEVFQAMTKLAIERDAALIARLEAVGFRTDYGDDLTGHRMKYLRDGGGYYINIGCSELIANGDIPILKADRIVELVPNGALLDDGSVIEADTIVLATGYKSQRSTVEQIFGEDVASRVGDTWGYDERGELRAMYSRTAQPGLWFHAGSLPQSRIYSHLLALQLKASVVGLLDPDVSADRIRYELALEHSAMEAT